LARAAEGVAATGGAGSGAAARVQAEMATVEAETALAEVATATAREVVVVAARVAAASTASVAAEMEQAAPATGAATAVAAKVAAGKVEVVVLAGIRTGLPEERWASVEAAREVAAAKAMVGVEGTAKPDLLQPGGWRWPLPPDPQRCSRCRRSRCQGPPCRW